MSVSFVILAAGRGTRVSRVGGGLHKALLPLGDQAVISDQLELIPASWNTIVCVGHNAEQVINYVRLAHPDRKITFVLVPGWDRPGGGPGASLLAARAHIPHDDHIAFTTCDTLWEFMVIPQDYTWFGTAPIPVGTSPARWCRLLTAEDDTTRITGVLDKTPVTPMDARSAQVWVGMGWIERKDKEAFWTGLWCSNPVAGERQVSSGIRELLKSGSRSIHTRPVAWTDVGDEDAYRHAVLQRTGYDSVKIGQTTFVLPNTGQVVKYNEDDTVIERVFRRGALLGSTVPTPINRVPNMLSYPWISGMSGYAAINAYGFTALRALQSWYDEHFFASRESFATLSSRDVTALATRFYRDKTLERVAMLSADLRPQATDAIGRIDWNKLVVGVIPGNWHGDFNLGNVIMELHDETWNITAIDWRADFAGEIRWGDLRYDLAKLLQCTQVNWDATHNGDFAPTRDGELIRRLVLRHAEQHHIDTRTLEIMAALTLINSAPLHAPPLDEILVSRAVTWLGKIL